MFDKPRLFGINSSNRDFTNPEVWGKNQFNSSFPTALACYMYSRNISPVYIKANKNMERHLSYISVKKLFGINPLGEKTFYSFETQYTPFSRFIVGDIPRNDLVIQRLDNKECISSLEIKLTALPDQSTYNLSEDKYGSEIVVRPDTIIYLACSLIKSYNGSRRGIRNTLGDSTDEISDWTNASEVIPFLKNIYQAIKRIVARQYSRQKPILMQPVWKTIGKSPRMPENCLDLFVWSDLGLLNLFMPNDTPNLANIKYYTDKTGNVSIDRHTRTMVWLYKMLLDYSDYGAFDRERIIGAMLYGPKNDKAFSSNGAKTHPIMTCKELTCPRITRSEIKSIILGNGQNLLSPERRFDAIIFNSPDLFKEDENGSNRLI